MTKYTHLFSVKLQHIIAAALTSASTALMLINQLPMSNSAHASLGFMTFFTLVACFFYLYERFTINIKLKICLGFTTIFTTAQYAAFSLYTYTALPPLTYVFIGIIFALIHFALIPELALLFQTTRKTPAYHNADKTGSS